MQPPVKSYDTNTYRRLKKRQRQALFTHNISSIKEEHTDGLEIGEGEAVAKNVPASTGAVNNKYSTITIFKTTTTNSTKLQALDAGVN